MFNSCAFTIVQDAEDSILSTRQILCKENMAKKPKKVRIDQLLLEQGFIADKKEATKYILAGLVRTHDDHVVRRATETYPEDTEVSLNMPSPYVSRGAMKLKPALEKYCLDLTDKIGMDVGSSTGGFSDLMLQNGLEKVYAVDSGTHQLHYKLRADDRVVVLEQTNAKYINRELIPDVIDVMTCDVSFISVTQILPASAALLSDDAYAFILIKPQFEVPKADVGDGVIRSKRLQQAMVDKVLTFAKEKLNWNCHEVIPSPLKGPKGNQEYVAVFQKDLGA